MYLALEQIYVPFNAVCLQVTSLLYHADYSEFIIG